VVVDFEEVFGLGVKNYTRVSFSYVFRVIVGED